MSLYLQDQPGDAVVELVVDTRARAALSNVRRSELGEKQRKKFNITTMTTKIRLHNPGTNLRYKSMNLL
jgi:hypothetical protein